MSLLAPEVAPLSKGLTALAVTQPKRWEIDRVMTIVSRVPHDLMVMLCQLAGLLPEEMPVVDGIGVVPTVVGARKIAAFLPEEERVAFLDQAAEVALLLAEGGPPNRRLS
jgi:hypothetical protein